MKKETKRNILIIVILVIILGGLITYFVIQNNNSNNSNFQNGEPPEIPGGENGEMQPPEKNNGGSQEDVSDISYLGQNTIERDTTLENVEYSSSTGGENALLVNGGTSTLKNIKVTKEGDESSESSDFYGTNAAILALNEAILTIENSEITTEGSHANGVFSYGTGIVNVKNSTIKTTKNNSGGLMVTGGGNLIAVDCNVTTDGNSSAAIRSDRGGGLLTVNGGNYLTNGVGSPAIYSTAEIIVSNAKLTSTASEGAIVEGKNSIILNNVTLTDTNTTLNGNSETYKNIFLYQSMSGDADEGTASFTAVDSTITTNKGDTIFVTNTNATVNLTNNTIINKDGDFLRIQAGKWGRSGSNGGNVTLNMINQLITGNIIVDSISSLTMNMNSGSHYEGTINAEKTAGNITLKLDESCTLKLTGDSYITSLEDTDTTYSNIDFNGYKLYVNGTAIN